MSNLTPTIATLAAITLVATAAWLHAGPINPPGGPVGPTGLSLTDLSNQITSIAGQAGGTAIPGNAFAGPGTMSMTITGTPLSVPVYSVQQTLTGGQLDAAPSGQILTPSTLLVVTDIAAPVITLANVVKSSASVQNFVVTMPRNAPNTWSITGTGKTYIRSINFNAITKANGQIAQVAVIEVQGEPIVNQGTGVIQAQAWLYGVDGATVSTRYNHPNP